MINAADARDRESFTLKLRDGFDFVFRGDEKVESGIGGMNGAHGLAFGRDHPNYIRGRNIAHVNLTGDHRGYGEGRSLKLFEIDVEALAGVKT